MQAGGQEPGPALALHAQRGKDPQHHDGTEEDQRDRTRSPRRVPEDAVRHDWNQEPPDTTVPLPDDAEPTPLDGCSAADELDEDDAELVELAEVEELEAWPGEVEVPGMVAALTAVKTPSPANAAMAAPVVRRLSL